jgi:hypothetical protein
MPAVPPADIWSDCGSATASAATDATPVSHSHSIASACWCHRNQDTHAACVAGPTHQHDHNAAVRVLPQLVEPALAVEEGLPGGQVVHHQRPHGAAVVGCCDGAVSLLPCTATTQIKGVRGAQAAFTAILTDEKVPGGCGERKPGTRVPQRAEGAVEKQVASTRQFKSHT